MKNGPSSSLQFSQNPSTLGAQELTLPLQRAEQLSGRAIDPFNAQSLLAAARLLAPQSRYLGGILAGGISLGLWANFQNEVRHTASQWRREFHAFRTHNASENYERWSDSLFSQSPQERQEQVRAQAAEVVMRRLQIVSPQLAAHALDNSLNREVGLREVENALRRSSLFFATSNSDRMSILSNFVASAASGYVSALRSRSSFSVNHLAFSVFVGALNGAVQCAVQMAPQVGDMTGEQIRSLAFPLAWQFVKSLGVGAFSGLSEYAGGRFFHSLGVQNPLARVALSLILFSSTDVGGEIFATHCLTQAGQSLGLEEETLLEASGRYNFLANFIDEVGGKIPNHFSPVNLMNVGALGALAANSNFSLFNKILQSRPAVAVAGLCTFLMPQISEAMTLRGNHSSSSHLLEWGLGAFVFGNVMLEVIKIADIVQGNLRELKIKNSPVSLLEREPQYYHAGLTVPQRKFIRNHFIKKPHFFSKVILNSSNNHAFLTALHEAAEGKISFSRLVRKLFDVNQKDLEEKMKEEKAFTSRVSLKCWLAQRKSQGLSNPLWLENAIEVDEELAQQEIIYFEINYLSLNEYFKTTFGLFKENAFVFDRALGFSDHTFYEEIKEHNGLATHIFILLPYAVYEKASESLFIEPLKISPCSEDLDLEGVEREVVQESWPLQIWRYLKKIHEVEAHPAAQASHDLVHWIWLSLLNRKQRSDNLKFYNAYRALPRTIQEQMPFYADSLFLEAYIIGYEPATLGIFNPKRMFKKLFKNLIEFKYKQSFLIEFANEYRKRLLQVFSSDLIRQKEILEAFDQARKSLNI